MWPKTTRSASSPERRFPDLARRSPSPPDDVLHQYAPAAEAKPGAHRSEVGAVHVPANHRHRRHAFEFGKNPVPSDIARVDDVIRPLAGPRHFPGKLTVGVGEDHQPKRIGAHRLLSQPVRARTRPPKRTKSAARRAMNHHLIAGL